MIGRWTSYMQRSLDVVLPRMPQLAGELANGVPANCGIRGHTPGDSIRSMLE